MILQYSYKRTRRGAAESVQQKVAMRVQNRGSKVGVCEVRESEEEKERRDHRAKKEGKEEIRIQNKGRHEMAEEILDTKRS